VALLTQTDVIDEGSLSKRLRESLAEHNSYPKRSFSISVSFGFSLFDPQEPLSIEALLANADKAMYLQKRSKEVVV